MKFDTKSIDYSKFGYTPEDIDPEILPIVNKFNLAGLKTQFSSQGCVEYVDIADRRYLNYSLPYLILKDVYNKSEMARIMEIVDELDLCTLSISYNQLYNSDINFSINKTIDEYTKMLDKFKNLGRVLYIGMNEMILTSAHSRYLKFPLSKDPDTNVEYHMEVQRDIFELARKRFLSELDKLAESCLRYRIIMNTLYGEE